MSRRKNRARKKQMRYLMAAGTATANRSALIEDCKFGKGHTYSWHYVEDPEFGAYYRVYLNLKHRFYVTISDGEFAKWFTALGYSAEHGQEVE